MKLKPQPRLPRRTARGGRPARAARSSGGGRGRQARRPEVPFRRRFGRRLPSLRRFVSGLAAALLTAGLVALINAPVLRVHDVGWTGETYTPADDIDAILTSVRGASVLTVDTEAVRARIEQLPPVENAWVTASLDGAVTASIVEREPAFLWQTASAIYIGAADGTIFAGGREMESIDDGLRQLPLVRDNRFLARLVRIGEEIPQPILRIAMRLADLDPVRLGSSAKRIGITLDDEYGFRLISADPAWEIALGVYGLDPTESNAAADARLERQVTAVRTLFASHPEAGVGWVDVRNPGKVYFRAKG